MARSNIENYEPVKIRKKRFFSDYPDGRIIVDAVTINENQAVFKAFLYKNAEDQDFKRPLSTGHAQEFKGQGGMANKFAWCENCEESAIGRALDNAGYSTNDKCSREEMIKVQRAENYVNELKAQLRAALPSLSVEQKQTLMDEMGIDSLAEIKDMNVDQLTKAVGLVS